MFDFSGKKVLVTGADRGLGKAMAIALASSGCKVYALDMVHEHLDTLAKEHQNIVPIHQDLSKWDETRATLEKLEPLDGLVNNASVHLGFLPALELTECALTKYINNNVFPAINCIQVIGKKMIEADRKGSIVNISSIVSQLAYTGQLGYDMAKAALDMVSKQFALELGPHGIRVNSVSPTYTPTTDMAHLVASTRSTVAENIIERTPLARQSTPEDVSNAVMYLLSDMSSMVTGTVHLLDGGLSCNITTKQ